ncbi:MAG: hypothetical protein COC01_01820 [Bacteroidetes bacterium]|nr:MAG: hypothetical protein COC01_01820 [Bacteroidota bacterium]
MKKLLLLTLIGFISYTSIAQEGILVGPKYSINTTWLFDQDEYESNTYNYGFTLGSMKGVNVGFQFSPKYGAEIDLFSTSHNQKYLNSSPTSEMYYIEKLKYFDIATYFRVRSEQSATYFMIGPKFSFFNKALIFTHSDNGDESKLPVAKDEDIYNKLNVFIELAYGLEAELVEDKLTFLTGFRAGFGFLDITHPDIKEALEELGGKDYKYWPKHALYGGFEIGINYYIN